MSRTLVRDQGRARAPGAAIVDDVLDVIGGVMVKRWMLCLVALSLLVLALLEVVGTTAARHDEPAGYPDPPTETFAGPVMTPVVTR